MPIFFGFSPFFSQKNYPHIIEELRQLCAKFMIFAIKIREEEIFQSLNFWPFFQLLHSAVSDRHFRIWRQRVTLDTSDI